MIDIFDIYTRGKTALPPHMYIFPGVPAYWTNIYVDCTDKIVFDDTIVLDNIDIGNGGVFESYITYDKNKIKSVLKYKLNKHKLYSYYLIDKRSHAKFIVTDIEVMYFLGEYLKVYIKNVTTHKKSIIYWYSDKTKYAPINIRRMCCEYMQMYTIKRIVSKYKPRKKRKV